MVNVNKTRLFFNSKYEHGLESNLHLAIIPQPSLEKFYEGMKMKNLKNCAQTRCTKRHILKLIRSIPKRIVSTN